MLVSSLSLSPFLIRSISFFFRLAANDRGYGHWRFAGEFPVVERQGKCGRKTAGMHVSQPMSHRRVLGVRSLVSKFVFRPLVYAKSLFVEMSARIFVSFLFDRKISRKVNCFS